jgi:hypothetical protein
MKIFSLTSKGFAFGLFLLAVSVIPNIVSAQTAPAITRTITVTSPNTEETLALGTTRRIYWTNSPNVDTVSLYFYDDAAAPALYGIVANIPNTGYYDWTVGNSSIYNVTTNKRLKITVEAGYKAGYAAARDSSDAFFTVQPSVTRNITVTSPNGGENLTIGTVVPVKWTSSSDVDTVSLYFLEETTGAGIYTQGGGLVGITGAIPNTGSYNWTVGNSSLYNITTAKRLKITVAAGYKGGYTTPQDSSNEFFSVAPPTTPTPASFNFSASPSVGQAPLAVLFSAQSEANTPVNRYYVDFGDGSRSEVRDLASGGNNMVANHTYSGVGTFNVTLHKRNCATTATASECTALQGQQVAQVGVTVRPATTSTPIARSVTVTSPNGGERYVYGQSTRITWTTSPDAASAINYGKINLYFVDENALSTLNTIALNVPNTGSYDYSFPPSAVERRIRIVASREPITGYSEATDYSNAYFTLAPSTASDITRTIAVTSPNGGENLTLGTVFPITWTVTPNVDTVSLLQKIR